VGAIQNEIDSNAANMASQPAPDMSFAGLQQDSDVNTIYMPCGSGPDSWACGPNTNQQQSELLAHGVDLNQLTSMPIDHVSPMPTTTGRSMAVDPSLLASAVQTTSGSSIPAITTEPISIDSPMFPMAAGISPSMLGTTTVTPTSQATGGHNTGNDDSLDFLSFNGYNDNFEDVYNSMFANADWDKILTGPGQKTQSTTIPPNNHIPANAFSVPSFEGSMQQDTFLPTGDQGDWEEIDGSDGRWRGCEGEGAGDW
jgi:hypothetical protein